MGLLLLTLKWMEKNHQTMPANVNCSVFLYHSEVPQYTLWYIPIYYTQISKRVIFRLTKLTWCFLNNNKTLPTADVISESNKKFTPVPMSQSEWQEIRSLPFLTATNIQSHFLWAKKTATKLIVPSHSKPEENLLVKLKSNTDQNQHVSLCNLVTDLQASKQCNVQLASDTPKPS